MIPSYTIYLYILISTVLLLQTASIAFLMCLFKRKAIDILLYLLIFFFGIWIGFFIFHQDFDAITGLQARWWCSLCYLLYYYYYESESRRHPSNEITLKIVIIIVVILWQQSSNIMVDWQYCHGRRVQISWQYGSMVVLQKSTNIMVASYYYHGINHSSI